MKQLGKVHGPAYALRVGDLMKVQADVTAVCLCGHSGIVDVSKLFTRWGEHGRLAQIEDKLKCTRCRAVGTSSFTIKWKN